MADDFQSNEPPVRWETIQEIRQKDRWTGDYELRIPWSYFAENLANYHRFRLIVELIPEQKETP
jgi:hypothetical protein